MKKIKPNKNEGGITLITLIVSIILLIILAAVTIKTVVGKESMIDISKEATNDYNIMQYREQIEEIRENVIQKYNLMGKNLNLGDLAKEMLEETTWIKTAEVNTDTNEDIIVTTEDGYVYQVYYNEGYGQRYIEYIGRDSKNSFPSLKYMYDKINASIVVNAKDENSGIEKVEIIHRGEVVGLEENVTGEITFKIEETGWYIIKVTSKVGKLKYAWTKIASTLAAPKIEVISEGENENGYYGKDKKEVVVRISTEDETVKGIYYTLEGAKTQEETYVEGKSVEVRIKESGRTVIYAHVVDTSEMISETKTYEVYYDDIRPEIEEITIRSGTEGENGWYTSDISLGIDKARDNIEIVRILCI